MSTLVCRLSGPLQSWGEDAKFTRRTTLPYPTYSGLLGLARAALGHTRDGLDARTGNPADDTWLHHLDMAIRIDQPGKTLVDYHTVNPPPVNAYHWLSAADRAQLATVAMGNSKLWTGAVEQGPRKVKKLETLQTWRTYLTDATFTWLIHGHPRDIQRLHHALHQPYWQLSLGRKACLPDQPLVLGTTDTPIHECAQHIPATGPPGRRAVHHFLHHAAPATQPTLTHADLPFGPHPHHGHGYLTRTLTHTNPPTMPRHQLLDWAKETLT